MTTVSTHTPNPWSASSYGPITGSGARKLASSRVAPLVALARNYWSFQDKEGATKFANMYRGAAGVGTLKNTLVRLVTIDDDEDMLVMPWYSAKAVAEDGTAAKASTYQYRPATPIPSEDGKVAKYKFFPGQSMVIDLHPATPIEWLQESKQVLTTEGLLKGDAALTAQLVEFGPDGIVEELSKVFEADGSPISVPDARLRLQELMLSVPAQLRTVIATSASVTTWQGKDSDWRKVGLRGKRVIVAFDGDLDQNLMVWKETDKMFKYVRSEKGEPTLLTLFSAEVAAAQLAAGMDPEDKLGIDDYFDKIGTWQSLLDLQTPQLPAKPQTAEANAQHGDWRVHPQNDAIVEEYVEQTRPDGSVHGQWVTRSRVGGRLISHVESRRPTETEISSGVVDDNQKMRLDDASCEIEIAMLDRNQDVEDTPEVFRVYGPSTLMSMPPQDWARHAIQLPNEVLAHPDWPPRKGLDWLGAVKANKRDRVESAVAWNTMGWVPVPGGTPAFIVGEQIIAASERDRLLTRRGVDERLLPGASKFGVIDEWDQNDIDGYKAQVRDDIRKVLQAFVENGFWKNRAIAVAVVCAMFRPTIPKHPGTTLFFVGPKGEGKSYTASFIMKAWSGKLGTWSANSLPGSAGDTFGAHESSVALAPIWIIDDLAPQSDRRKAEQQLNDLEQIVRAMYNNSAKRRLDGRTMEQRDVANPIAMLAVTGENAPSLPSIQDRTLTFLISKAFNDTEDGWREKALLEVCDIDGAPARLAAAMIRFWQHDDTGFGHSWVDRQEALERTWREQKDVAFEILNDEHGIPAGEAARLVGQISSIGLTLKIMYQLAQWAGMEPDDKFAKLLGREDGYMRELYDLAAEGVKRARSTTPGTALLKALGGLMATGKAHLRNATTPGAPPFSVRSGDEDEAGTDVATLNQALGWEFDARQSTWVPKGPAIGYFGAKNGEQIALFDTSAAFKEAQRAYPELIPHGQTGTQSWGSVYTEGLALGGGNRKESVAARTTLTSTDEKEKVSGRLSGIPVLASKLFELAGGDTEEE